MIRRGISAEATFELRHERQEGAGSAKVWAGALQAEATEVPTLRVGRGPVVWGTDRGQHCCHVMEGRISESYNSVMPQSNIWGHGKGGCVFE